MNAHSTTLSLLSAALLVGAGMANADPSGINCGDTVNLDGGKVVLNGNLDCTTDPALTVVGPGTFDMNGYTLRSGGDAEVGLQVQGERANVINGVVVGDDCGDCVRIGGEGRHTLEGVVARGCYDDGFEITSGDNELKSLSSISNGYGYYFDYCCKNTLRDSLAITNDFSGLMVFGSDQTVRDNSLIGNGDDGIEASGEGHNISGNTVSNNGSYGIETYCENTRIQKNHALDNEYGDLYEDTIACGQNRWLRNIFGTANDACIE